MNLLINFKEIYDSIHGFIKLSKMACLIIDTIYFQRLRYIHQLGTCHYVFPTACHSRFEHSIGTYYLAGKVLDRLKNNSDPILINNSLENISELQNYFKNTKHTFKLDNFICELIKIAALCHDLGHGPFSHVFDDIFIKSLSTAEEKHNLEYHENRSCEIFKKIIKSNLHLSNIIDDNLLKFICDIINPPGNKINFIYQIVSNNLNGVDVDKFDYIVRDTHFVGLKYSIDHMRIIEDMKIIDDKICFPDKISYDLISLFETRYRLHKQIYSHKTVISIQYMINEIMILLNEILGIFNSIFEVDKFIDLTDDYIINFLKISYKNKDTFNQEDRNKIEKAYQIWININERKLYKCIKSIVSDKKIENLSKENIIIFPAKIGFVSGSKKNPIDHLYFYKLSDPNICFKMNKNETSYLIPSLYQEFIYLFFERN